MKRLILVCILSLVALPLWAGYGLSNVVTKEIHRAVPQEEPVPVPEPAVEPEPEVLQPAPKIAAFTKTAYYPYTIHMSSWQKSEDAMAEIGKVRSVLDTVFVTKIDLGPSGIWFRVDYGVFPTIKDAVTMLRELMAQKVVEKGAFVGSAVPYAIEIGIYESKNKADDAATDLDKKGIMSYVLRETDTVYRLLYGAYPDTKSASPAYNDLKVAGLSPTIKKR